MLHHQVGDDIEAIESFDLILGDVHREPNVTWDPGDGKYEMGRKNGNWKGGQMNESSNFAFFHTCGNLVEAFNLSQIIDRQRKQFIGMARQKRESRWDQALTSISCHQVTTKKPEKW